MDTDLDGALDYIDPCTTGVRLSYKQPEGKLRLDLTIGSASAGHYWLTLVNASGEYPLIDTPAPALLPAIYGAYEFSLPPIGVLAAVALFSDGTNGGYCYDIDLIDTGSSSLSSISNSSLGDTEVESQARSLADRLKKGAKKPSRGPSSPIPLPPGLRR